MIWFSVILEDFSFEELVIKSSGSKKIVNEFNFIIIWERT